MSLLLTALLLLLCFYDLWKLRGGKVNHTAEFPSGIFAADVPPLSWHVAAVARRGAAARQMLLSSYILSLLR